MEINFPSFGWHGKYDGKRRGKKHIKIFALELSLKKK